MSIYAKTNTFSANTLIKSADINTNFDEIATAINTTLAGGGNAIIETKGGTNQTSYSKGDTLYASAANTLAKLAAGTANQVMQMINGVPTWQSANLSGINYISANPNAEVDTAGWATYADAAGNTPVDGTGGSPTSTWTRSTVTPLRGAASFLWTKAGGANRQGEGVAFDFTIDTADQAKPLAITCDYSIASGTFTASDGITAPKNDGTTSTSAGNSDLEFFIYDKTNAVLIPVSPQVLTGNQASQYSFKAVFQTAPNSTSYRLIVHTATATTNNFTVEFDNFFVGPQSVSYGAPILDTRLTTTSGAVVTFTNFGSVTAVNVSSQRIGDKLAVVGSFTSGTAPASVGSIDLVGLAIDYTKLGTNAYNRVGDLGILQAASLIGSNLDPNAMFVDGSTASSIFFATSGSGTGYTKANGSAVGNTQPCSFSFVVPIVGWASSVLMSNDTDTRVCAAVYQIAGSVSASTTQPINYATKLQDTHGAVTTGSSWKFTAPISGFYLVTLASQASAGTDAYVYKNGTAFALIAGLGLGNFEGSGSATVYLVAGDYIDIRYGGSTTTTSTVNLNTVGISRISGPSAIAATESVSALYTGLPTGTFTDGIATFPTKVKDTHTAYSSGAYVAPSSGSFSIAANVSITHVSIAVGNYIQVAIFKNGVEQYRNTTFSGSTGTTNLDVGITVHSIPLLAGDSVTIRVTSVGTTPSYANATQNTFSIVRTGN